MDLKKFESGAVATPPDAPESPSDGYPSAGNPATATPATKPGPYWFYQISEELKNVVESAGLTPDLDTLNQLNLAINAKIAAATSQGQISGFVVTNNASDLEHDIDISAGSYGAYSSESIFTKKLDEAFAEGTGNGGMVGSLPTSGVVYIFLITKDSDGTLDVYAETTNGTNPPSGWTVAKRIAARPTDASANLINVKAYGNGEKITVTPATLVADFSLVIPTTTRTFYPVGSVLSCPPGVIANVLLSFEPGGTEATSIIVTSVDQTDIAPDIATMHTLTSSSASTRAATELSIYIGPTRQIYARASAEPVKNFKAIITSWIEDRS